MFHALQKNNTDPTAGGFDLGVAGRNVPEASAASFFRGLKLQSNPELDLPIRKAIGRPDRTESVRHIRVVVIRVRRS